MNLLNIRKRARRASVLPIAINTSEEVVNAPVSTTGQAISDSILDEHVVKKTREQYKSTFQFISKYCFENIPDSCDDNGTLILPMAYEHIETFFGNMAKPRPDGSVSAKATMTGCITVIKFMYNEGKLNHQIFMCMLIRIKRKYSNRAPPQKVF